MKKWANIVVVAVFLGMATTSAMAEGFYAALDAGETTAADACTEAPASLACRNTAALYRFAGGYQFDAKWGVEASYGDYGKAALITTLADWQLSGLQVAGTATFPLGTAFSMLVKLGIAQTTIKLSGVGSTQSATSTQFAYGVGVQYDLSENLAIRVQYEDLGAVGDANIGKSNVSLLSGGIVVRF
jgi:OOP family OmpA-OmpF porin